ncbi:DUF4167 domain-containing protein [Ruegeria sp. WL0004]|uniref:DUF4167 domain-containing protein n=1 Tax=Ruegeria marisflavi TaxID=2984152 RepID=A0ABT2WM33_9RHOB|nr:DUF4167 domain-containing protein [Ruegeria sp. WL0004]MCU9836959.1 DUF4167 domain-containing protein [Ruegeria sp. WL0004]
MRSSKSRSRSKNNRNRPTGGNVVNRVFDSSGPEGKVRGTPQQIIEKYNQLARDAQLANDRVAAENFQQHAEHYTRLLSEAQREIDARREEQERHNRERQVERDRERAERQERESNTPADLADAPQPSLLDMGTNDQVEDDSGLVETPESRGGGRPKRKEPAPQGAASEPKAAAEPEGAAEPKPKKPRRPRTRKPAAADEPTDPQPGGGPAEAAE